MIAVASTTVIVTSKSARDCAGVAAVALALQPRTWLPQSLAVGCTLQDCFRKG